MDHLDFGRSVNPFSTKGADYAHHITICTPGFSDHKGMNLKTNNRRSCLLFKTEFRLKLMKNSDQNSIPVGKAVDFY